MGLVLCNSDSFLRLVVGYLSTVVIDSSLLSLSVCVRLGSTPGSSFGPGIPLTKFQIDQRSTARGRARKNFRTFTVRVGSTFVLSYIQYTFFFSIYDVI